MDWEKKLPMADRRAVKHCFVRKIIQHGAPIRIAPQTLFSPDVDVGFKTKCVDLISVRVEKKKRIWSTMWRCPESTNKSLVLLFSQKKKISYFVVHLKSSSREEWGVVGIDIML